MAILLVCGVNSQGIREVLAIEPMLEEPSESYRQLFQGLKERGMKNPKLVISDAHSGLVSAIRTSFPGASWQRCKVHFMRNILAHIPHKAKSAFAAELKEIWLAPSAEMARERAVALGKRYENKYSKAIETLDNGLEDSLSFYFFPTLDSRKIASSNMLERLNKEIRRRTRVIGIFPGPDSYVRLITTYLMEYAEDWSVSRAYMCEKSLADMLQLVA